MSSISRLPRPLLSSFEWQVRGKCRTIDPDQFFPSDAERGRARATRVERAKALCSVCPVIQECLQHAMSVREPYGVWGGTTPDERNQLMRGMAS